MLKRFKEIRDKLLQSAETEGSAVPIDRRTVFKRKEVKLCNMFCEINRVTLLLQSGNEKFYECRMCVESLLQELEKYCKDAKYDFYGCSLGKSM